MITFLKRKGKGSSLDFTEYPDYDRTLKLSEKILGIDCEIIDYIASTGTQYINTGIKGANDVEFEIKYRRTVDPGNQQYASPIGAKDSNSYIYTDVRPESSIAKALDFGEHFISNRPGTLQGQDIIVSLKNNIWLITKVVNNETYSCDINEYNTVDFETPELFLFGWNQGSLAGAFGMRLYYCKLWKAGELVRDFVPILRGGKTKCLYDKISNEIFYNAGTGNFT